MEPVTGLLQRMAEFSNRYFGNSALHDHSQFLVLIAVQRLVPFAKSCCIQIEQLFR